MVPDDVDASRGMITFRGHVQECSWTANEVRTDGCVAITFEFAGQVLAVKAMLDESLFLQKCLEMETPESLNLSVRVILLHGQSIGWGWTIEGLLLQKRKSVGLSEFQRVGSFRAQGVKCDGNAIL